MSLTASRTLFIAHGIFVNALFYTVQFISNLSWRFLSATHRFVSTGIGKASEDWWVLKTGLPSLDGNKFIGVGKTALLGTQAFSWLKSI